MSRSTTSRDAMLLEAGLALSSELSLAAVLQRIIELAAGITGARYGALGVLGPDGLITQFITTGISQQERAAIGHLPVGRGILGALIRDAKPLRLADISRDPRSVGFPPNHPPMRSFLGAPVKARGLVFGNIYLTEKQGAEEFGAEDEEALLVLATQAGVAVENARLYEDASRREQRLEAIREITTATLRGSESQEVLTMVAGRARELLGADLATIVTPGGEGTLAVTAADGEGGPALLGLEFPADDSVSGNVMDSGEPVLVPNASGDPRTDQPLVGVATGIGPALFVPLSVRGRAIGTLAVANGAGGRTFDAEDLALVQAFADQASVALEFERAQQELRRLAVLDDRERIAKELHDGVIQSLFAVGMGLQAAAAIGADAEMDRRLEGAVGEIDRVIRDLRNYIFGLRPGILADRQLDQALHQLAREFEDRSGVTTVVDVDAEVAAELGSRAGDVVQLAREALSNVGRHAAATTCRVSLSRRQDQGVLEVDDDGRGFDTSAAPGSGQGLRNLRERVDGMGGRLEIDSTPSEGTTVRAILPL